MHVFFFRQSKLVQEASGWSTWLSSFVSVLPGVSLSSSGGICTQSLLAVLKAHSARSPGWRSLELGSLLLQIGSLLNRKQEDAKVSWHTATC